MSARPLMLALALSLLTNALHGAAPKWEPLLDKERAPFIMALAEDKFGNVWIGTEDKGVFRYNPSADELLQWTQFTTKDGLGDDNAYAIACDELGRVWVGTLNHGVSVFTGDKWKTYDVLDGPLGERVFAIEVSPKDGSVWIATNGGLTRYSVKQDTWTHFTRADGLPSEHVNSIAFDKDGSIYVGTDCDGIGVASFVDDYKKWSHVAGPIFSRQQPLAPFGRGLPSGQINAVLVTKNGNVYVATASGLGKSQDKGKTWTFIRGRNYGEKVKGLLGGAPQGWQDLSGLKARLLPEDYVTCLKEDADGNLYLGFRQAGLAVLDAKTNRVISQTTDKNGLTDNYVAALFIDKAGLVIAGTYGKGVVGNQRGKAVAKEESAREEKLPPFPSTAAPPSHGDLQRMLDELRKVEPDIKPKPAIVPLTDDWRTQGTWIDRYANFAGVLCAMGGGGTDFVCGYMAPHFAHRAWLGKNCRKGDYLRYWVHWIHTNDRRSLQNRHFGGRKQSEWDDHGEEYPMSLDGPHVYGTVLLPKGHYVISTYIFNKDGHDGYNRFRDFLVELKLTPMTRKTFDNLGLVGSDAELLFEKATGGARSRVHWFWGGVHKRFSLTLPEPGYLTVRVNRNYSFNTIISSIFVDPVDELCGPEGPERQPAPLRELHFKREAKPSESPGDLELRALDRLLYLRSRNPVWYASHARPFLVQLIRAFLVKGSSEAPLAAEIEKKGKYPTIRPDLAICLNDLQLFDHRDRVSFKRESYESFTWQELTQLGQSKNFDWVKYKDEWKWDWDRYWKFVRENEAKQTWDLLNR
jgi:hypothetical protein